MLITENQLDEWVGRSPRDAQGVIVELVWRLVAASCPRPRERRFPLGDSIGQHGPDGISYVDLGFEPFVPEDRSFWEIGIGQDPGDKATRDYNNRTADIPQELRSESTFVFVTPRSAGRKWEYTWKKDAQAAWLTEHRNRKEWRGVRVIDGTTLVDWILQFPAVELWLAQRISGSSVQQIETPEQGWDALKSIGEPPPLTPEIFLANRADACAKLKDIFDGTTMQLKLTTHYPNQAVDFVCAYMASLTHEDRVDVLGRSLIISGADAWNTICGQKDKHILIADPALDLSSDAGTKLIQKARRAGHAVIFGGPQGGIPDPTSVALSMPSRHQIQEALEKAGYSAERARTLAQKSGGNLASLLRCLQNLSLMPEWAERSGAAELAIAAILGAWSDDSSADRVVVEVLSGKSYGEWIGKLREIALRPGTPLIQREGNWKFVSRYEGWYALGPRLFDEHLGLLLTWAVSVLREKDPQFELPREERYAARIHGKELTHSHLLRNGLAEALALVGSHPQALTSCTFGKAESVAHLAVHEILADADWVLWASLNDLLSLLAEADPRAFLDATERALRSHPCPFDELFAQESEGALGRNYMSGLLWALETLAWDPDHLNRVMLCLGELATRDPGGNWTNGPGNSLTTILLPWLPQTCAPIAKRVAALRTLLDELPDIGWKLLVSLLPKSQHFSITTRRPAWRATIPEDWSTSVTHHEYWVQVSQYAEMALAEAKLSSEKLSELITHMQALPPPVQDQLLAYLASDAVIAMSDADRLRLWNELVDLTTKYVRFADAELLTMPVDRIAAISQHLAPSAPFFRHQRLFSERDFDLYEKKGNYREQTRDLDVRRQKAVEEVAASGGVHAVIVFARAVQSPWRAGIAFGAVASVDADDVVLPDLLKAEERPLAQFAGGFVWSRFRNRGWPWVDSIETSQWTGSQIGQLLSFLPFTLETWERAKRLLGEDQSAYWKQANPNPYEADAGLETAIGQLLQNGRPGAAIRCLDGMLQDHKPFDMKIAIRVLLAALTSSESPHSTTAHEIVEIIKALQDDPDTNQSDLFQIEWAYLPLLDEDRGAWPRLLWRRLANNPSFFCEMIRLVFRPRKEERPIEELSDDQKNIASNAYHLLSEWKSPPGCRDDGSYNGEALASWLDAVQKECTETGHLEVAMTMVGHALIYTPPDPDGLWIHRSAAAALNAKDAGNMLDGFQAELSNSRGVHWIDPTGKPERELAEKYRGQAETLEIAGYHRLATVLRDLAQSYAREAERIRSRDQDDD